MNEREETADVREADARARTSGERERKQEMKDGRKQAAADAREVGLVEGSANEAPVVTDETATG